MSDFNIVVKVDPTQAKPTIDGVRDSLVAAEQAGAKAGKTITDGMVQGADSAEKLHKGLLGISEVEGNLAQSIGQHFGEAGGLIGKILGKGTLEIAGLVGLGAELTHIADEYTQLSNTALRLSGSEGGVNDTIKEQLGLAGDLHGSLEQTMELSIAVKERTDDLNLTHDEQLRLTKSLGEASVLSGHSAQDAAGAFERLGFMLENGQPAGRQMRQLLIEFPALADVMKEHFNTTGGGIVAMAQQGKLSLQDFIDATSEGAAKLDEKMSHLHQTLTQQLGHALDAINVAMGQTVNVMDVFSGKVTMLNGKLVETAKITVTNAQLIAAWQKGMAMEHNELVVAGMDQLVAGLNNIAKIAPETIKKLAIDTAIIDPWKDYTVHVQRATEAMREAAKARAELFQSSLLSGQANKALQKQGGYTGYLDVGGPADFETPTKTAQDTATEEVLKRYQELQPAAEKYRLEVQRVMDLTTEANSPDSVRAALLADLKTKYGEVKTPAEEYAKAVLDLDQRQQQGLVTAASYGKALDDLKMKFNQGDALTGFRTGLDQINKSINVAASSQKLLTDAFGDLETAMTSMVTKGSADWGAFVTSMLTDMTRLLENQLFRSLINAFSSGGGGGVGSGVTNAVDSMTNWGGAATGGYFDIPHAANGFAGIVRQQSGADQYLAAFHVNAGERVTIQTPQQQAAQQGGQTAPAATNVRVVQSVDRSALMEHLDTPEGEQVVHAIIRRSPRAIKSYLGL